jgi:hypothetical protein
MMNVFRALEVAIVVFMRVRGFVAAVYYHVIIAARHEKQYV